jgi:hypothetical protein
VVSMPAALTAGFGWRTSLAVAYAHAGPVAVQCITGAEDVKQRLCSGSLPEVLVGARHVTLPCNGACSSRHTRNERYNRVEVSTTKYSMHNCAWDI